MFWVFTKAPTFGFKVQDVRWFHYEGLGTSELRGKKELQLGFRV